MSTVRLSRRELRPSRIGGSVTTGMPSTSSSVAWLVKISKYRGTIETWTSGRRTERTSSSVSSWLPTDVAQHSIDLVLVDNARDLTR